MRHVLKIREHAAEGELRQLIVIDGCTDAAHAGSLQDVLFFGLMFAEAKETLIDFWVGRANGGVSKGPVAELVPELEVVIRFEVLYCHEFGGPIDAINVANGSRCRHLLIRNVWGSKISLQTGAGHPPFARWRTLVMQA